MLSPSVTHFQEGMQLASEICKKSFLDDIWFMASFDNGSLTWCTTNGMDIELVPTAGWECTTILGSFRSLASAKTRIFGSPRCSCPSVHVRIPVAKTRICGHSPLKANWLLCLLI
jgi:hypothetical protein